VQVVSLTPGSLATTIAVSQRPSSRTSAGAFRLGSGAAAAADDVIDVDVLWEDVDEAPSSTSSAARSGRTAAPARPFVLVSPLEAVAAYRSAASTRDLPHRLIDLHV
jgi:hypothetical protein